MLADPFVLGAESLPRVWSEGDDATYRLFRADGLSKIEVFVRHSEQAQKGGGAPLQRANVEVRETIFATATAEEFYRSDYLVSIRKSGDVTVVNVDNLADYVIAGTNANYIRILKGES